MKRKIHWARFGTRLVLCMIVSWILIFVLTWGNTSIIVDNQVLFHSPFLLVTIACFVLSIEKEEHMRDMVKSNASVKILNEQKVDVVNNSTVKIDSVKPTKQNEKDETKEVTNGVITFADIAGYETTKDSVRFIVKCLKDQNRLKQIGAKMPNGILLYGPPGTGKTYMAKAIAGEAGVPFFSVSASSFVNTYVGVGAKNVRAFYEKAKKNAPCVVFIDELDAIGSSRTTGDTNSEMRSTLNELLVQMDGMNSSNDVLTIAATNTPGELDSALVRPGRFDRKISMPLPDVKEREAVLSIHCRNKTLDASVDLGKIAISTPGFSCSGLATLVNEAALHAVFLDKKTIDADDFEHALFQIIMEGEQKKIENQEEIRMIAYHESGHALAVKLLAHEAVPKVTIIGSTSGAGGVTFRAENDHSMYSKKQMETQIMISYAGRAAEELFFGNRTDITTGASADIKQATNLIRGYISTYGMSEDFGMLNMDVLTGNRNTTGSSVIGEAKRLSSRLYSEVLEFLTLNREKLDAVAEELLAKETVFNEDLDRILGK